MRIPDMKQRSTNTHDFSMIPRAEIPRSSFPIQHNLKTSFSFSYMIPILCVEVLPGDHWNCRTTIVARTAVPIVPVMDNWHLETFAFFVPCRLVWDNWVKFMGEQTNPGDSIAYTIPQVAPVGGWAVASVQDYFGLPTVGQVTPATAWSHSCLPLRAYNLIWNQWFRDENLQASAAVSKGDGPDAASDCVLLKRGKRHDYFTSALPWPQKGNTAVTLPLGTSAIVKTGDPNADWTTPTYGIRWRDLTSPSTLIPAGRAFMSGASGAPGQTQVFATAAGGLVGAANTVYPSNLYADLSTATAATINQLRQSFQVQKLLERDARGGTRYTEIIRSHFGVVSPDARLQRPEYIGGGRVPITTNAIPQTSATGLTGGTTPAGTLAATGHAQGTNGFSYAATEHGYIIMLANGRADLTYQQGLSKMWSRSTRYDFYFPVFAMLGEQAILSKEIYLNALAADNDVFGYQERWAEYRYLPNRVTGLMRATSAGNIAYWHSAQLFSARPTLNTTFMADDAVTVLQRNFAGGASTVDQQILADIMFTGHMARPLPAYSVPGLIDHF